MKTSPYELTVEEWHELIDFNNSIYPWNPRRIEWFEDGKPNPHSRMMRFNSNFAGKKAGAITPDGYVYVKFNGKRIPIHRIVWFVNTGKWPELDIDHINGNRSDNRFENLREVTRSQNLKNRKRPCNNTSGCVGVIKSSKTTWTAQINLDREYIRLGTFNSFEAAVAARKAAEIEYGYHPNHGMR